MDQEEIEIYNFIEDNDFVKLKAELKVFNPFSVLKIDAHEIRHSNMLAWLFQPEENHKLGDLFLREFLKDVLFDVNNSEKDLPVSIMDVREMQFKDVKVKRENKDRDILIISKEDKIVILIENKIGSGESQGQLKKYLDQTKADYQDYKIIPIYLTIKGYESTHVSYLIASYEKMYHYLKFVIDLEKDNMNGQVRNFIQHYVKTLGVITMQDDKLKEICKKIYSEHRDVIELIRKHGNTILDTAFGEFQKLRQGLKHLKTDSYGVFFLPLSLIGKLPEGLVGPWQSEFPLTYLLKFDHGVNTVELSIMVGPIKDPEKRVDFLKKLQQIEVFKDKITDKVLQTNRKYKRIFTVKVSFEDWEDEAALVECINAQYDKINSAEKEIERLLETYEWN